MKLSEVQIGEVYVVRVSGRPAPVKLVSGHQSPGSGRVTRFEGYNLATGRQVTLTAAKCRRQLTREQVLKVWPEAERNWPEHAPKHGN